MTASNTQHFLMWKGDHGPRGCNAVNDPIEWQNGIVPIHMVHS